jgi:hypothetical protein
MASEQPLSARTHIPRLESWYRQHFFAVLLVFAAIALFYIVASLSDSKPVDWLFFASIATCLIGVRLAIQIPERITWTLSRLMNQGTLRGSPEQIDDLRRRLDVGGARWALLGAIGGTAIMLVTLLASPPGSLNPATWSASLHGYVTLIGESFSALSGNDPLAYKVALLLDNVPYVPVLLLIGCVIGYYIPYAVSNGRLGHLLRARHISLQIQPGFPDGAASLSSVGALYFFQAQLLAIPALFFAVWSLLFVVGQNLVQSYLNGANAFYTGGAASLPPYPPEFAWYLDNVSVQWLTPFLLFFFIVVAGEVLAFLVPMWSFHTIMAEQKRTLIREVDSLGQRIVATQRAILDARTYEEMTALSDLLAAMKNYYESVMQMPTWPVNSSTAWRFVIATTGPFLPVLAQPLVQKLIP